LDKKFAIKTLIEQREEKLLKKREELIEAERAVINAPRAVSTNPESDKKRQYERIRDIRKTICHCEETINMLNDLSTEPMDIVEVGALVTLRGIEPEADKKYLIIPNGERCSIPLKIREEEIGFVSIKSPVGQAILGLKIRNKVSVKEKKIEIISIQ
jgi:transcription elongation GreA/GreB family factor